MDSSLNADYFQLWYDTVDKAGAKLQSFANLREAKWNDNGVFQAFLSPWRGPWKPLEINLQMPDGTAFISSKSGVDRFRNSGVIGITRKNVDRQTAFQLYIVDYLCIY